MILFEAFEKTAQAFADKVALIFEGQEISYAALLQASLDKAYELGRPQSEAGPSLQAGPTLQAGDRVFYEGLNHPEALITLLACAKLGLIYVALNYQLAAAEIEEIKADALVTPPALNAPALNPPALRVDPPTSQGGTGFGLPLRSRGNVHASGQRGSIPTDALMLVYTSGTTGKPKGALHTQNAMLANARAAWSAHGMQPTDRVLSCLPLFHVGGLCIQTLPALLCGATVVLHAKFDPTLWLVAVAKYTPTLSLVVPAVMKALIEHPHWHSTNISSLRGVMAGSSVVPMHLIEAFHARGIPVGQVYGSTETGPVSVVLPFDKARSHIGMCGWPHANCTLELRNKNADGVGQVWLQADNLMWGYWGQNKLGSEPNLLDGFHTGDLGRWGVDGCLQIVGRSKDMLISGGENIYPAEIENALLGHPDVVECAVIGVPDAQWGEVPVAFVVLAASQYPSSQLGSDPNCLTLRTALLRTFLESKIAKFKLPKRYVRLDELPKTALGKVEKARLAQHLT